jgi:hypothetical protein
VGFASGAGDVIARKKIILAVALAALAALGGLILRSPRDADRRYADLHQSGTSYARALRGQPRMLERAAAWLHGSAPLSYYRVQHEGDRKALMALGYLTEITFPMTNLKANAGSIHATLTNTLERTGAYYEGRYHIAQNEFRLLCRTNDVELWRKALSEFK